MPHLFGEVCGNDTAKIVRPVPNSEEPTGDAALAPMTIVVPMILIESAAGDRYWHHEPMDRSTAERFAGAINCGGGSTAAIVEVPVILPRVGDIADVLSQLDCQPLRAQIVETVTENPYERTLQELRAVAGGEVSQ